MSRTGTVDGLIWRCLEQVQEICQCCLLTSGVGAVEGMIMLLFVDFRGGSCGGDDHVVVC